MSESALNNLLSSAINVEELDTEYHICPEVECNATISGTDVRTGNSDKMVGRANSTGMWASLNIAWDLDSEDAREELKRDKITVYQSIFLTVVDDAAGNPRLDLRNNQELAVLTKLFDIDGETVQEVIDGLQGQLGFVSVTHEIYKDRTVANVTSVSEAQ